MTENTKPQPGTPEYDAAMIAKAETGGVTASHTDANGTSTGVEGSPPPAPSTDEKPARPEWMPEKFWTGDLAESTQKLAASYAELERGKSKPKDEQPPPDGEQKPAEGEQPPALAALGERASQEIAETGKLSDEVYEGYEKAGISRVQVDTYIAGIRAQGELIASQVHAEVGGKETFTAIQAWAGANLSEPEQQAFNNAVFGDDEGARMNAVRGLKARFEAENGRTGNLVKPRASAESTGDLFRSKNEMTAAMRDPKYKADAAYRADVARKIANSANAGIDLW